MAGCRAGRPLLHFDVAFQIDLEGGVLVKFEAARSQILSRGPDHRAVSLQVDTGQDKLPVHGHGDILHDDVDAALNRGDRFRWLLRAVDVAADFELSSIPWLNRDSPGDQRGCHLAADGEAGSVEKGSAGNGSVNCVWINSERVERRRSSPR